MTIHQDGLGDYGNQNFVRDGELGARSLFLGRLHHFDVDKNTVNLTVRVNPTKRDSQRAKMERYFLECVS